MIIKIVNVNNTNWDNYLTSALWTYHAEFKATMGFTSFKLIFGTQRLFLIKILVLAFNNISLKDYAIKNFYWFGFHI